MEELRKNIQAFCFWITYYALMIIVLFDVKLKDIGFEFVLGNAKVKTFFIVVIVATIVFLILSIIDIVNETRKGRNAIEIIVNSGYGILWVPYKGFDIRPLFVKTDNISAKIYNKKLVIINAVKTVIWWVILYFECSIVKNDFHTIKINKFNHFQLIMRFGIAFLFVIILNVIFGVAFNNMKKLWKSKG